MQLLEATGTLHVDAVEQDLFSLVRNAQRNEALREDRDVRR